MNEKIQSSVPHEDIELHIENVLDEIRPAIEMDGGSVSFVKYDHDSNILTVSLSGACRGCPMSEITLKQGIEQMVKERIPSVREVVTQ